MYVLAPKPLERHTDHSDQRFDAMGWRHSGSASVHNRTDIVRAMPYRRSTQEGSIMASAVVAVASERSAIHLSLRAARPDARTVAATPSGIGAGGHGRQVLGWLEDAVLLLLVTLAFPLAILAVGAPIALAVRLLIEIGRRWH